MYRFNGLDSLMAVNGINSSKAFDAYLQRILDKRQSQAANLEGFVWDAPQIDFTYEMLKTQTKVDVMASYVDLNSPALPAGKQTEISKLSGSIPRMRYSVVMGENDYRKRLIALNDIKATASYTNTPESVAVRAYLNEQLYLNVSEIATSFKESLNYQVGQMKSLAQLELTDTNNPRGSIRATFKAQVPAKNFIKKGWFNTDGTPVADADPVNDLRDFNRELRWVANGYQNITVEMGEKYLYKVLAHPAVLKAIGYSITGLGLRYTKANDDNALAVARGAGYEAQKAAFKMLIECDELITSKTQCGVEKLNATTKAYERTLVDAFADGVILIRPQGNVGVIKNVACLRPDASHICGSLYGGRGKIEYKYNADTYTQRWDGELTALAVPTRPDDMYYFVNEAPAAPGTETA